MSVHVACALTQRCGCTHTSRNPVHGTAASVREYRDILHTHSCLCSAIARSRIAICDRKISRCRCAGCAARPPPGISGALAGSRGPGRACTYVQGVQDGWPSPTATRDRLRRSRDLAEHLAKDQVVTPACARKAVRQRGKGGVGWEIAAPFCWACQQAQQGQQALRGPPAAT